MLKSKFTSILLFGAFFSPLTTTNKTTNQQTNNQHTNYKKMLTNHHNQQTDQFQLTCPNGTLTTNKICKLSNPCPLDAICYRKDNMRRCCGNKNTSKFHRNYKCSGDLGSFCPTKMHTFHSWDSYGSYSWEMTGSKKWYNVTHGNESIACPLPFSFAYVLSYTSAGLPTDFDVTKPETSKPKVCKKNSDCNAKSDEFCGEASNPSYPKSLDRSASNHTSFKFCYKSLNFGFTKIKPIIEANRSGLILCDNNSDCFTLYGSEIFCFIGKEAISHADSNGNVTTMSGVCAVARVCDTMKYVSSVAELSKGNDFCKSNGECNGISECNVFNNTTKDSISMCCQRKNTKCQVGLISVPVNECFSNGDCVSDNKGASMNQWCDEKGGHCCRDDGNRLWACPDGATPLFDEPTCNGYTPSDIHSGSCPQEAGICKYGHCCPPLKINDANETVMGQKPYITNLPCNPDESVPPRFKYAFCDPEQKKIVIMGEKGVNGEDAAKEGKECKINTDCKPGYVCVSEIGGEHQCYFNPLIEEVCEGGKVRFPVKKCSSFEECNIDGKEFFIDRWCNEGQYCCRDGGNMSWACPDGATQLFNEPKCNGYIPSDIHSGSCPQEAGICKYGHCCPPLKINDANETVMGQKPYIINFTCNPEESVPSRFKYAFCDPEKKKIVIMGEKGVNGEDAAMEGKECKTNSDCKPGYVCVSEIGGEHQCYFNPLIEEVCEVGKVRFPVKKCSSFQECNNDEKELLIHQWCDEKNRHCCRDNANKLWACPDRATPLFNEPKCNGSIAKDINSGSCPQNSGICKYGHCCPPSKINDANETVIGKKPYITNVTCNPEEPLPTKFKYAFCDPENNTIVIMGEKDVNGEETVKKEAKCKLNKDCKQEHVCVSEINGEHHCFFNALIVKKEEESSQFWKYVIIGAIVCAALFLIASVMFFICRMKSKAGKKAQSKSTSPMSISPMSTSPKPTGGN